MTLKGEELQLVEGPMISTNEESFYVVDNSLVKREPGSKFLIKEKLGNKSMIERELDYILIIGMGTFLHRYRHILPS